MKIGSWKRRIYYAVKRFVPRWAQIAVRRLVAGRVCRRFQGMWPTNPCAGSAPERFGGWPQGRKFALVLTHDVEHLRGMGRCLALAGVEKELGFVSSFNFVPERYAVAADVRETLAAEGFEIAVHDLLHDGKLYSSKRVFLKRAVRINRYLRQWSSVGFRSGSMLHNLEWIKALDIEWDSSTFDTDPFEPQPDALGRIYPLWVPPSDGLRGYVELPYTLPQDLTLFVLLQQPDVRTWKEKLDWIAERGGMALVNTHPDYMCPRGDGLKIDEYPEELYREFLRYVLNRYAREYWNALPREVARFWRRCVAEGVR